MYRKVIWSIGAVSLAFLPSLVSAQERGEITRPGAGILPVLTVEDRYAHVVEGGELPSTLDRHPVTHARQADLSGRASSAERAPQETDRCAGPEYRQFDFWLGRWEVRNPEGEVVGHNEIRRVAGGCGLLETWRGAGGGTGTSLNTYDADRDRWTQRWVGTGATLWLEGGIEEDSDGRRRMVLAGTRPRSTPGGPVLDRIAWTALPDGRVRQVWETSSDGGETWEEAFVGLYSRVAPEESDSVSIRTPEAGD